ncbi:MAG: Lrp/AsnC family transcriptional regulator [Micropepsaceae bacterium]
MPADLDAFDRGILKVVQGDNLLTHAQIGERVNLSPSSVRRRLTHMREQGVIAADVSIVDPTALGTSITVIVSVTFERERPEAYEAFRKRMIKALEVTQCYSVAGAVDFVLICHARDLAEHERWAERVLMTDPNIRRCDSQVAWSRTKFTTRLPV